MRSNLRTHRRGNDILKQVCEGMTVYDCTAQRLGEIVDVCLGIGYAMYDEDNGADSGANVASRDAAGEEITSEDSSFGMIVQIFDPRDVPQEVARSLQCTGFIRLTSDGLINATYYVTPDQIETIVDGKLYLHVAHRELIRGANRAPSQQSYAETVYEKWSSWVGKIHSCRML
jgi:hypothetical protein